MRKNFHTATHRYSLLNSASLIYLEFSQTGESCDRNHRILLGEIGNNGFKSRLSCNWYQLSEVIGIDVDELMAKTVKFSNSVPIKTIISDRERYCSRVGNRRDKGKCDRIASKIRIC